MVSLKTPEGLASRVPRFLEVVAGSPCTVTVELDGWMGRVYTRSAHSHRSLLFHTWSPLFIDITWLACIHHPQLLASLELGAEAQRRAKLGRGRRGSHRGQTTSQKMSNLGRRREMGTAAWVREEPRQKQSSNQHSMACSE